MNKKRHLFNDMPEVAQHSISDFLFDEEASIPKGRLMAIGTLMVILAFAIAADDAFAGHRSHSSHKSHSSHRSHSSHSSHSSGTIGGYPTHSNSFEPVTRSTPTPYPSSQLKTPRTLPDTVPVK